MPAYLVAFDERMNLRDFTRFMLAYLSSAHLKRRGRENHPRSMRFAIEADLGEQPWIQANNFAVDDNQSAPDSGLTRGQQVGQNRIGGIEYVPRKHDRIRERHLELLLNYLHDIPRPVIRLQAALHDLQSDRRIAGDQDWILLHPPAVVVRP